jgi:S-formylglutathione hydrolase FrmB
MDCAPAGRADEGTAPATAAGRKQRSEPTGSGSSVVRRLLLAVTVAFFLAPAVASAQGVTFSNGNGITVDSQQLVNSNDPRLYELELSTSALPSPVDVRVLLPTNYDPSQQYPVLYLLDGTSGSASDWTDLGNAEQTTAGLPLIVVMPNIDLNGDGGGWCTNWSNGAENWETFHIDQLIPWVDANLPTIANRSGRAIAGLSQGGFCSMSYAARYPDMFSTALAFSGAPDIWFDKPAYAGAKAIINATETYLDGVPPDTFFGNSVTDQLGWAAHDPATLAENLADTKMYLYWGNGFPGEYDVGSAAAPGEQNLIEGAVYYSNEFFQQRLDSLNIPAYYDAYGDGTHSWPYWAQDLQDSIGDIMNNFANPPAPPSKVTYTSAEDQYSVYGWTVAMNRTAQEFSTLESADSCGFRLAGSGSGTVTTPDDFTPGDSYTVSLSGPNASGEQTLVANSDGQLTVQVPLGPSNPYQEYTAQAEAAGTKIYTTVVTVGTCSPPAAPPPCSVPPTLETGSQVAVGPGDECATDAAVTPDGTASTSQAPALPTAPAGDTSPLPASPAVSGTGNASSQSGPAVSGTGSATSGSGEAISGGGA